MGETEIKGDGEGMEEEKRDMHPPHLR